LSLLNGASLKKLKVCPNCNWLFLDKSRNSSRLWCDMAVCGNRVKAKHHYRRQRLQREKTDG
jgi:predicted RNA-binding Zn ribbon-like protein